MTPTALFVLESSPLTSPRAVEGVRIAVGVGAWKKIEPVLYLRGEAALLLVADLDYAGEDEVGEWLRLIGTPANPILVESDSAVFRRELRESYRLRAVSNDELPDLARSAKYLLRF
jgi:hypothetical protein